MEAEQDTNKGEVLREALAEYFEVEVDSIHGFIFACERDDEEQGLTMSSSWSLNTPFWHLIGYLDECKHHLERNYRAVVPQAVANGSDKPNRAARRGRGRGRTRG